MISKAHQRDITDSQTVTNDLLDTLLGRYLGKGVGRMVFECAIDKKLVVKVEMGVSSFQNVLEAKIWSEVKDTKQAKWFAPVIYISPCGTVILQEKVEMIEKARYPKRIPHFFTDQKYQNYGLIGKQFVCFDYGSTVITNGFTNKMKNAEWWED